MFEATEMIDLNWPVFFDGGIVNCVTEMCPQRYLISNNIVYNLSHAHA